MPAEHVLNVDLADVRDAEGKYLATLAWGDEVEVLGRTSARVEIAYTTYRPGADGPEAITRSGFIRRPRGSGAPEPVLERSASRVLKVDFVDVQQGDASVIETPQGKVVLIDGGDNVLFARYLAARFRGTSHDARKEVDCILVTHGDADHFAGLTEIHGSEHDTRPNKRLFIRPLRVYHNGLVKRPGTRPEREQLGATTTVDGKTVVTGLETDLLAVPSTEMNNPFKAWKRALSAYRTHGPIEFRRLAWGDDEAFDFLAPEGIRVEVLGPLPTSVGGVTGLEFFGEPKRPPRVSHPSVRPASEFSGLSASHTINGHSIVFRLTYGGWRFLYAGDLNEQSAQALVAPDVRRLRAEVFKVPHHGSADFSPTFLRSVAPLVSIVSSGDETARKEYIHPRATLMSAVGKFARSQEPLVFVTELVAFFESVGEATASKGGQPFFAFQRAAFGLVKVRTDGARLLVWTNSGQVRMKEAYAYVVGDDRRPAPSAVLRV